MNEIMVLFLIPGFYNEISRSDRDQYITVNFNNVLPRKIYISPSHCFLNFVVYI